MFNSLEYATKLEEGGFSRKQAETQMQIMGDLLKTQIATKQDLKDLEVSLRHEIQDLRLETQLQFKDVRSEMAVGFAKVDARFAEFETRLIRSTIWTMTGLLTIFSALNAILIKFMH